MKETRIQNMNDLISHGNVSGRKAVLEILEAALEAADPYHNIRRLISLGKGKLIIGNKCFEPRGTPRKGNEIYDLSNAGSIYVFGAGKGCQRVAKALEDVLGDRVAGGHVIDKKGHDIILERIGVTLGGHPLPDEDCVKGCRVILDMTQKIRKDDLVFTITTNGVSSLLTMPVPGVSIKDIRNVTYMMQIERGAPTSDLNPIRNHLDMMKGGRISTYLHPATMFHIIAEDPDYIDRLLNQNFWLATLPHHTTFQDAVKILKKWRVWNDVSPAVRKHLDRADPKYETIKPKDFEKMSFRIFGIMPKKTGMIQTARKKAEELGFNPIVLAEKLQAEANQAGLVVATIARTIEQTSQPFDPPCALLTSGELLVTVGNEKGMGGRNQEFILSAAIRIAGSRNIVMGAVDSDGNDGPGSQFVKEYNDIHQLAGGVVDGETVEEARNLGINIVENLKCHNATIALWNLKSGIIATNNISLDDISVTLIDDPKNKE